MTFLPRVNSTKLVFKGLINERAIQCEITTNQG